MSSLSHTPHPLSAGPGLTITDLLELPRPASATPNSSASLALWPSSTFSFTTNRTEKSFSLIDLPASSLSPTTPTTTGATAVPRKVLTGLTSLEFAWLDERTFLFLRPPFEAEVAAGGGVRGLDHPEEVDDVAQGKRLEALKGKGVEVWAKDVLEGDEYLVGVLPVAVSNLKIAPYLEPAAKTPGVILAFSATVFPDGDPYKVAENEEKAKADARGSDVRVYDSVFVRHWDEWKGTSGQLTQLHFVKLTKNPEVAMSEEGFEIVDTPPASESDKARWSFVSELSNQATGALKRISIQSPLAGTTLECPVGAFGGASDFDLSGTHLVFHAKDPHLNQAWHTRTQVYLVPLSPRSAADAVPKVITVGNQGAASSPAFSKDGTRVAWLEMREDGYEADRNRLVIYEVESGARWGATEKWDRSPSDISWSPSGDKVYLLTQEEGRVKVFQLIVPLDRSAGYVSPSPVALTHKHSTTSLVPLSPSAVLLTTNSLTSPNTISLLSLPPPSPSGPPPKAIITPLASLTNHLGESKDLDKGESFWFPGAAGHEVHGFILFPPGVPKDAEERKVALKGKKFPLAFLVHGGPQSAWTDSWSTRWNPNIYASHGYITVTINPTGSTGYGQAFCDAIKNNWGGSPFQDLVAGLHFVQETFPEIDSERTAMLGASYGGYMANWIQGHNDQTKFKAIVCHDGVFSTSGTWYGTEELYFPEREFGGTPWQVPDNYNRWDPQNHIAKWRTPQLVIHGGRDYRLNESEGLGVFNTLQRLGVPSRFVYFGSENHWVLEPHNGVRWHEEVLKWIDEWTSTESVAGAKDATGEEKKTGYAVGYLPKEE